MLDESSELPTLSGEEVQVLVGLPIISTLEIVREIQPPSIEDINTALTVTRLLTSN